ncbi:hypothetical protein BV133_992 [Blastochloris viridis]|uniref:Peptidase M10 metallopeptidase domain-containing protein n=1 Tax=Blastochloris viridis TaxID=1079 RepID=A0A182CZD6_BLAVI|nr:hypothetical protein BV133_992 [Blastochloris viridis]
MCDELPMLAPAALADPTSRTDSVASALLAAALRAGCYVIALSGDGASYDGSLRITRTDAGVFASGDLYQRPSGGAAPMPAAGIPVFARVQYRYYLKVTEFADAGRDGFTLGFETWRLKPMNLWARQEVLSARMMRAPNPALPADGFAGAVSTAAGAPAGTLTMAWVAPQLRRASIAINHAAGSEAPTANDAGASWPDIFGAVGWDVAATVSDAPVEPPLSEAWSDAELHAAMMTLRGDVDLDNDWQFHILAVPRLKSTDRGIMYDVGATDSNNGPRKGVAIASHWVVPDQDPWGLAKGRRVGTIADVYFRTAVHEIGHALGLFHNSVDNGFMATTDRIADRGTAALPFPTNVSWAFAPDDQHRLGHLPDPYVRPGGAPFGDAAGSSIPLATADAGAARGPLRLEVSPLLEAVPIGAPVRVLITLRNDGAEPALAPATLSMKSGGVSGAVVDPAGTVRSFRPLIVCLEHAPLQLLPPGGAVSHALTLLRGAEGALFPIPGRYDVRVSVTWEHRGGVSRVVGETAVEVLPAAGDRHAKLARRLIATPDLHLTLILGGDFLPAGLAAIAAAVDDPVLRSHYGYVEARRRFEPFRQRSADLAGAQALIAFDTVMSPSEIRRTADEVLRGALNDADDGAARAIGVVLRRKLERMSVPDAVAAAVDRLPR